MKSRNFFSWHLWYNEKTMLNETVMTLVYQSTRDEKHCNSSRSSSDWLWWRFIYHSIPADWSLIFKDRFIKAVCSSPFGSIPEELDSSDFHLWYKSTPIIIHFINLISIQLWTLPSIHSSSFEDIIDSLSRITAAKKHHLKINNLTRLWGLQEKLLWQVLLIAEQIIALSKKMVSKARIATTTKRGHPRPLRSMELDDAQTTSRSMMRRSGENWSSQQDNHLISQLYEYWAVCAPHLLRSMRTNKTGQITAGEEVNFTVPQKLLKIWRSW